VGHPLRLRIAAILAAGPEHVGALAERLEAKQAIVSQQLRILRLAGVVAATRASGQVIYRLLDPRVFKLLGCLGAETARQPASEATS
jgi:ArsR family transcriptional regulator